MFTNSSVQVRPLKPAMSAKGKGTVKRCASSNISLSLSVYISLQSSLQSQSQSQSQTQTQTLSFHVFSLELLSVLRIPGQKPTCGCRFSTVEAVKALAAGRINLEEPFLVEGGLGGGLEALREMMTAENLVTNQELRIRYVAPAEAKEARTFDQSPQKVR